MDITPSPKALRKVVQGRWFHDPITVTVKDIYEELKYAAIAPCTGARTLKVYIRYLRNKQIYDDFTTEQLRQLCVERGISLRGMPCIFPGPETHPFVQESRIRLHLRYVEALEKPEYATTLTRFMELGQQIRQRIYGFHFQHNLELAERGHAAMQPLSSIMRTNKQVQQEAIPVFFDRPFDLRVIFVRPDDPLALQRKRKLTPKELKQAVAVAVIHPQSHGFSNAPVEYLQHIRVIRIGWWAANLWYDGSWLINLDAATEDERVVWICNPDCEKLMVDAQPDVIGFHEKRITSGIEKLKKVVDNIIVRRARLAKEDSDKLVAAASMVYVDIATKRLFGTG